MSGVSAIGLDLAKHVFQAYGANALRRAVLGKQLRRQQVLEFFGRQPPCAVAMEACSIAHFWARELAGLGHMVRLIPPACVRPFVIGQKGDASDAEAIAQAAQRPTMRVLSCFVRRSALRSTSLMRHVPGTQRLFFWFGG